MADPQTRYNWRGSVAAWLIRWRVALVVVAVIIFFPLLPVSRGLQFDRTITAMFSPADKTFQDYMLLREHFGSNTVVMLVYHDPGLMTVEGMERNRVIAQRVEKIDGVIGVLSTSLLEDSVQPFQPVGSNPDQPALLRGDEKSVGRRFNELFEGYSHSDKHDYASIVTVLGLNAPQDILDRLEALADEISADILHPVSDRPVSIMGEPVLIQYGFKMIESDGFRLATLTVVLLSFVVAISLGSMRFVILTAILIGWSVVVTRAIMVWGDVNLSIMSSILTAIITVIAVATILHLGIRFRLLLSRGYSEHDAAQSAIARLLVPIMVACLTDAGGFIALRASSIMPVQQFGFSISVGAIVVLFSVLLWAPAVMTFSRSRSVDQLGMLRSFRQLETSLSRLLRNASRRIAMAAIDHRWFVFAVCGASLAMTYYGFRNAKSETSFLNNFREDNKIVIAYRDVEDHFGGAGVWDIVLEAPVEISPAYLNQVKQLESELLEIEADGARLTKLLSLAAVDDIFSRGIIASFVPPAARLAVMGRAMPGVLDAFISPPADGQRWYRIMLRSREQDESEARNSLIRQVQQQVKDHTSTEQWRQSLGHPDDKEPNDTAAVTGYYVLTSKLVASLIGDQWKCLIVAGILVWLCIIIFTHSVPLAFAALIANLLPTALVLSFPGLVGERINMGATLIAAVSIGLSIDGSVHFLAAFHRLRYRGHGVRRSAIHAAGSIGAPLMWATVALVIGFAALSTSEFVPIATFGALVSATLAIGTLVNLTLLPVLVCAWSRES